MPARTDRLKASMVNGGFLQIKTKKEVIFYNTVALSTNNVRKYNYTKKYT
jgi:hypothetical protein